MLFNVFNLKTKSYEKNLIDFKLNPIEIIKNTEEKLNEYIRKIEILENFNLDYENFISLNKMIELFFDNSKFESLDLIKKLAMLNIYDYFKKNDIHKNEINKNNLKNTYDNALKIIKIDNNIERLSKMINILNSVFFNKSQYVEEDIKNYSSLIVELKNSKPKNIFISLEDYNLNKYKNLYTDFVNKIVYLINEANIEIYNSSSYTVDVLEKNNQSCSIKTIQCEVEFVSINHAWIWDTLQFRINEQTFKNYSCSNKISTIYIEGQKSKRVNEPSVEELKHNGNYQELPKYINQTYEKPSFNWDKIKNTAYYAGWTAAGTATLAGFGYGLYRKLKTGKPENVVNSIKFLKEDQPLCRDEELIMWTLNLENLETLSNLEQNLLESNKIQIEEELTK